MGAVADSYDITYGTGTLNIEKALLTVTANDCSRRQGLSNPEFTVSYDGFVNGDDASVLTKQPVVTTQATEDSPVGNYSITVSGAEAANYSFNYVDGTLTVLPGGEPPLIQFSRKAVVYALGSEFVQPELELSEGLTVKYTVEGIGEPASIDETTGAFTVAAEGVYKVTATTDGNANFKGGSASYYILALTAEEAESVVSDVNSDGKVTIADVTIIVERILGK